MIGILKPTLQAQFGWSEIDYADIVFAFQLAYAIGFLFAGRIMDRLGIKRGFALALTIWSLAAMAAAEVDALRPGGGGRSSAPSASPTPRRSPGSFSCASCSGSANREISPRRSRPSRNGSRARARVRDRLFNAGTNIGAVITPMTVPFITARFGWYWAFVLTGLLGFAGWSRGCSSTSGRIGIRGSAPPERALHPSDPVAGPRCTCRGRACFGYRQTWSFAAAKFLTDPIWWMYLFWLPDFFSRTYGLSLLQLGPPIIVIYVVADIGSVGGGWLSSIADPPRLDRECRAQDRDARLRDRGRADRRRGQRAEHVVRGGADQPRDGGAPGMVGERFTLASDMFPRQAVGSVVGSRRVCRRGRRDDDRETRPDTCCR